MKNIHLLPADKPSRLSILNNGKLNFGAEFISSSNAIAQYIYITSDEKFIRDEYITDGIEVIKATPKLVDAQGLVNRKDWKKIILTTDQDLIKNGVQAIDDNFLKWLVKNPSCEWVEVEKEYIFFNKEGYGDWYYNDYKLSDLPINYKIIITKEEPKQETLEEVALNYAQKQMYWSQGVSNGFIAGAKWQAERMYSEEEAGGLVYTIIGQYGRHYGIMIDGAKLNELFEQFKKK
jgi:hypothetical protein